MGTLAAVMTGKGIGAISVIQLFGDTAQIILSRIFKPTGSKPARFETGEILLGTIVNGTETIDQVVIGCEGTGNYTINCHGNPLIVADIMQLLEKTGATPVAAEKLLAEILSVQKQINTIALEAKLTCPRARTLEGTKIIANQVEAGLSKAAQSWLENIKSGPLDQIKSQAEQILRQSQTAKLIIAGCTITLAGPANTGKSTLLNCLAGRQKAIVTDIKGTTRDWVSAQCRIGPLAAELIDTAGLDESVAESDAVDRASQQRSLDILGNVDLVLLVLDNSQPANEQLPKLLLEKITNKRILTVLNKSDLPAEFDVNSLPTVLAETVQISAKFETGIENFKEKILNILSIAGFDAKQAVCFTARQKDLLKRLEKTGSKDDAVSVITELLNGQLKV